MIEKKKKSLMASASVAKIQLLDLSRTDHKHRIRLKLHRDRASSWRCRAFRSEEGESSGSSSESSNGEVKKRKGPLYSVKSMLVRVSGSKVKEVEGEYRKAVEKAEEIFFSVSSINLS